MTTENTDRQWIADRRDSDSLKWTQTQDADILPMWIADMDFRCAEPIVQALHERIDHGVFGYTATPDTTVQAVCDWLKTQHHWEIEPEWIVWTPGLVTALNVVCRAFASPEDQVLTFTPVYPPFMSAPKLSDRKLLTCPLKNDNGRYTIDFETLESVLTDNTRILLLCSPHNPVGRVWSKDELLRLAQVCLERNILLCSDEIHCDLVLDSNIRHIPTATLSNEIADRTITLMSPAKTFNIPGLNCGFAIIPNETLRQQYKDTADGIVPWVNTMGYTACRAALTEGGPWRTEILAYLSENHRILHERINAIKGLSMGTAEATYLAWIDMRPLNLPDPEAFFKNAGVGLIGGEKFGEPGFVRLNFACSREHLLLAIERIQKAVNAL